MSSSARKPAGARHPALNRMPRDFLCGVRATPSQSQRILKGEAR